MALNAVGVFGTDVLGQLVESSSDPVGLSFVDRHPSQHEVLLAPVAGRARVVEVQEMHDRRPRGRQKAAG